MSDKNLYVVFVGAPGSGKGTQAKILQSKRNVAHLSTGDMLRAVAAQDTEFGRSLKEILAKGIFVTDEIMAEMISRRIEDADCKNGFILDGFPRTLPQAEVLLEMLNKKGIKLDAVVEIQVADDVIIERITGRYTCVKCGQGYNDTLVKPKVEGICDICGSKEFSRREDDNVETVKDRLKGYKNLTAPILPFFEKHGLLKVVDGVEGGTQGVASRVDEVLS